MLLGKVETYLVKKKKKNLHFSLSCGNTVALWLSSGKWNMIISCLGRSGKILKLGSGRGIFRLCAASLPCLEYSHDGWSSRSHFESTRMRGIPGEWQRRKVEDVWKPGWFCGNTTSPGLTGLLQMIFTSAKTRVLFSLARVCKLSAHPQHDFPRKNWSKFKINVWDVKSSCSLGSGLWVGAVDEGTPGALPHSLCQTGPKGNCQFTPALHHQEDDGGVASLPALPQAFAECPAYAAPSVESGDSVTSRHASPAVLTLAWSPNLCWQREDTENIILCLGWTDTS